MKLSSRQINILKSCSLFLKTRSGTIVAKQFGWSSLMETYGDELAELAEFLSKNAEVIETKITVDDLFKN